MFNLRKIFKISLLLLSRLLGIFLKRGPIILMYHSVGGFNSKHSIDPVVLEKQLNYISSRYNVISLSDILAWMKDGKKIGENSVAISIDDGYKDTSEIFLPLLIKYNLCATLFLTSALDKYPQLGNIERPSIEDLKKIHDSKHISTQSHGHYHNNLSILPSDEVEKDLSLNKDFIFSITGEYPKYFAYPYGYKSKSVVSAVGRMFEAGFGIGEGSIKIGDDILSLKRVQVDRTVTFLEFKLRLTSALDFNRKVVDFFRFLWTMKK